MSLATKTSNGIGRLNGLIGPQMPAVLQGLETTDGVHHITLSGGRVVGFANCLVTPEAAVAMEAKNYRVLKPSAGRRLALFMAANKFVETHNGFAFDSNGEQFDGNHRRWAIARCGIAQWVICSWGWDRQTVESVIDVGGAGSRNLGDHLRSLNIESNNQIQGAVRILGLNRHNVTGEWGYVPNEQMADWFIILEESVNWIRDRKGLSKRKGCGRGAVMAVIMSAYYHFPDYRRELERFCGQLVTGLDVETNYEQVVLMLRNALDNLTPAETLETMQKTHRAVSAYLSKERLGVLKASPNQPVLFPLPTSIRQQLRDVIFYRPGDANEQSSDH